MWITSQEQFLLICQEIQMVRHDHPVRRAEGFMEPDTTRSVLQITR